MKFSQSVKTEESGSMIRSHVHHYRGHCVALGRFPSPLGELSHRKVCVITAMCVSPLLTNSQATFPDSEQYELLHLWIRVPADDKANGSWGTFAQDGVDFA